ncbi:YigZ family protein [Planococcus liqunii]|uniref:YigZ family protein n=1 Tax=Planococcus liqunii TaxID=3058394 RepID=A0ABT8MMV0_9BACL|nr:MULTISPECIES: YigZ family protein [unclassified Planococcus (in: firmicutes)]MDN7226222.1 YigZ family protein [Planococcus sp. N064]WKA50001.1 YigZ family protein [Planococcus sp. N056]
MRENYKTIGELTECEIIIQKSRFIGYAKRAETEKEALEFIESIKAKHRSANHNCSAYLIGEHDSIQKANDDGEPSGTAGFPMLEVLKKQGLKDAVVVVTRYFGGIKLGGGGLIRAYGKATTEAIAASGVVERRLHYLMKVAIDYNWLGKMENEVRNSDYPLKDIQYTDGVALLIYVPRDKRDDFTGWINEMTNGQATIESLKSEFLEFKIH